MARTPLPQSKLKMRKRRRRVRIGLLIFLLLVALVGGCVALLHASFWRISHLSVAGTQSVSQQAIESTAGQMLGGSYFYVIPKNNVLLYPKRALIAALMTRFAALSSVQIKSTGLTALSIQVAEYGPYALWCGESPEALSPCILMDKDGVAYASAVSFSGSAYARYYGSLGSGPLPKQYLSPQQFHTTTALLSQIAQSTSGAVASVAVDQNGDIHALFASGFSVIYAMQDDSAQTLQRFSLALSSEPFKNHALSDFEYLDLRFGDKLYYKLR